ncbi:MAG: DUF4249 domain-containing protein [Bacteroidales bacterium]|nr:DUF4249 domain-containing protein [Bacteroidales bacterium]
MRTLLILIFTSFMLFSCEKQLDILLSNMEKRIVINSFFNDKEFIHVNISSTQPATDDEVVQFINNACVLLYKNELFLDTLTLSKEGNYYSDKVIPEVASSYKLNVEVPGMVTATSNNSQIPVYVEEFSLDTFAFLNNLSNREVRQIRLKFKDIDNTPNYYLLYMIWVGTYYVYDDDGNIIDSIKTKTGYGQGEGINIPSRGKLLFTDEFLEGDTIEKNLYFDKRMYGSGLENYDNFKVYFKLCTVSEEYYLYGKTFAEQHNSIDWSAFVEPVTVYSNINNGEGIFAGYGYCIDSVFYSN